MMEPFSPADFNRDGRCDSKDEQLFNNVMGQEVKPEVEALVVRADFDMHQRVTDKDKTAFHQMCAQKKP